MTMLEEYSIQLVVTFFQCWQKRTVERLSFQQFGTYVSNNQGKSKRRKKREDGTNLNLGTRDLLHYSTRKHTACCQPSVGAWAYLSS
jgi:hypothetical protein